jgi:hypothetical protein
MPMPESPPETESALATSISFPAPYDLRAAPDDDDDDDDDDAYEEEEEEEEEEDAAEPPMAFSFSLLMIRAYSL